MQKMKPMNAVLAIALLSGTSMLAHAGEVAEPVALQVTPSEGTPSDPAEAIGTTELPGVSEGGQVSDTEISVSTRAALQADAQSAAMPVTISTRDGVVALTGSVTSVQAGDRVLQIVASVSGVREIKSELKVKSPG
jgi:hyperosmotically inducible protein